VYVRDDDDEGNLARWLKEVGHRRLRSSNDADQVPRESGEDLIRHLEELTGRKLASRDDIDRLLKDLCEADAEAARRVTRRRLVRETVLLVCLLVAYLHYQYWDVSLQIAAIPRVQFFVPMPNDQKPAAAPS
jgi:hypothetical protein